MDLLFMENTETMDEMVMKDEFTVLIRTMDLPEMRRIVTDANLRWFLRNARIRNGNHENLNAALTIARNLLR